MAIVRDITERKGAEEVLRRNEERFRTIAEYTFDWEYWRGPDGRFRYVSPFCQHITGYSAEEFMADPALLEKIVHPDDDGRYPEPGHRVDEPPPFHVSNLCWRVRLSFYLGKDTMVYNAGGWHQWRLSWTTIRCGHSTGLHSTMTRLLIFIGMVVGGYVGWWLGDYLGLGLMGTFLLSTLGSAVGVCLGWKVGRGYFDD